MRTVVYNVGRIKFVEDLIVIDLCINTEFDVIKFFCIEKNENNTHYLVEDESSKVYRVEKDDFIFFRTPLEIVENKIKKERRGGNVLTVMI